MFKWMQSRRRRLAEDSVPDPNEADRDSGEEEYAADDELAREVAPSGITRVKTDNIRPLRPVGGGRALRRAPRATR